MTIHERVTIYDVTDVASYRSIAIGHSMTPGAGAAGPPNAPARPAPPGGRTAGYPGPVDTDRDAPDGGGNGNGNGRGSDPEPESVPESDAADHWAEDEEHGAPDGPHTALPPKIEAWRRRSAAGAILTGFALGLQEALEKRKEEPSIVMETSGDPPKDLPVEADFEYGRPRQSVVQIRPWLLPDGQTEGSAEEARPDDDARPDEEGR